MATIIYSSFPPIDDELSPQEEVLHNPIDLGGFKMSDSERECGDSSLDFASHHLSLATPTKERARRATMPEPMKPRAQDFIGLYSPPQTPDPRVEKPALVQNILRPETPPHSARRLEIPMSPETPTPGTTLFSEQNQPTTPVLYNLIRNEGPPKFVIVKSPSDARPEARGECDDDTLFGGDGEVIRGHPSACLFVASLNSSKSEEHLRKSVTDLFSKWGTLLNVKVLKDWANRPFSFVQYTTAQEAAHALAKSQKACLDGRMIRVERARVNRTLYVSKEKGKIDEAAVKALLEPFGQVEEIVIPGSWKRNSKECRKGCFARFVFRDDAINAYQTLRTSDTYNIEWAQNLDRSSNPASGGTMHKVPIDYSSIFIGQLDRLTDEKAVCERFGKYGNIVAVQVLAKQSIVGRRPGDSVITGFAFVKYDGRDAATRAVKAENGSVFQGRTIRVQYRELHQRLYQTKNPTNVAPKLVSPPTTRPRAQLQQTPTLGKVPSTLGQLSGTGGLSSDAVGGFGGFDPVTGLANSVYNSVNPHFFAAYNAAATVAGANNSTSSASETTSHDPRRVLNPLAPPFMLIHPLQLAYLNRQSQTQDHQAIPVLPTWYSHPPTNTTTSTTTDHPAPFPAVPPAPADFASPIPLGPVVAVQSLFGFPGANVAASAAESGQGICWDPSLGMYRANISSGAGASLFEQGEGAANAA